MARDARPMGELLVGSPATGVVLDQYPLWLEAMNRVVARAGLRTLGSTTRPDEAEALIQEYRPDVFVSSLEFGKPFTEAIQFLQDIHDKYPSTRIVVISSRDDSDAIQAAFAAGAAAYCLKRAVPTDLAATIRQALERCVYFAPPLAQANGSEPHPDPMGDLTRREREILALMVEGHSNGEMARRLWVTEQTVKFHLSNIYRKLQVANRTEAARWAHTHGLVPSDEPPLRDAS